MTDVTNRLTIFLSYSRRDAAFCHRLDAALAERGYDPKFDQSERLSEDPDLRLTAQEEWWRGLKTMIAASDVMVFIVTPNSAASAVCDDEIAHARSLGKRVIAILRDDIDFSIAPERLRALNVKIDFRSDDNATFQAALDKLSNELDVDIEWSRLSSRLARQASQWDSEGRPVGQLLRFGAIQEIDTWISKRPSDTPKLGALIVEFLDCGRAKEKADRTRLLKTVGRAFVQPSQEAYRDGRLDSALRLTATGMVLSDDYSNELVPERETLLHFRRVAWESRLLTALWGHGSRVASARFSSDGSKILTASLDGSARIWDTHTGGHLSTIEGMAAPLLGAEFSPDDELVVTVSEDGSARIWEAATGLERVALIGHDGAVNTGTFSSDKRKVLTASEDKTIRVWDATTGTQESLLFKHSRGALRAEFCASDTRLLAVDRKYGGVSFWDLSSRELIRYIKANGLQSLSVSEDRLQFITGDGQGRVLAWNATVGNASQIAEFGEATIDMVVSSGDGKRVLVGQTDKRGERKFQVLASDSGRELCTLDGHLPTLTCAAMNRQGNRILTISDQGSLCMWDGDSGACISVLGSVKTGIGERASLHGLSFSPTGQKALCCWDGNSVAVFDTSRRGLISTLSLEQRANVLEFSADGERLAAAGDGEVSVYEVKSGKTVSVIRDPSAMHSIAFSPDGTSLSTGASLWDVASATRVQGPFAHADYISSTFLDSAGDRWASINRVSQLAIVRNVSDGEVVSTIRGHSKYIDGAAFSPCGKYLATASADGSAKIWDVFTGTNIASFRVHTGGIECIAFSKSGNFVATGGDDDPTIRLWDVASGREMTAFSGHTKRIVSVEFSRDDQQLLSASWDGSARLWDLRTGRLRATMLHEIGRPSAVLRKATFGKNDCVAVSFADDGAARIWDVSSGGQIALLQIEDHLCGFGSFAFCPKSNHIAIAVYDENLQRRIHIWDISRVAAYVGDPAVVLAAHLSSGRGRLLPDEKTRLIMEDAPNDLFEAVVEQLSNDQRDKLAASIRILSDLQESNLSSTNWLTE